MPCAISAALRVAGSAAAVTAALRGELLLIFIHLFIYFLWLAFLTGGFSVLPANSRRVLPLIAASAVSPRASQLGNAALGTKVASKSAVRASDVLLPKRSLKTRPGGAVGLAGWMRRGAGGEPRLGIAAPGPRCLWFLPPSHGGGFSVSRYAKQCRWLAAQFSFSEARQATARPAEISSCCSQTLAAIPFTLPKLLRWNFSTFSLASLFPAPLTLLQ